jgi:tetratricopeptide (TPR) repeat protein
MLGKLGKIWKRISEKRPRGAKLTRIVAILSAMVWISAGSAYILLKKKSAHGAENPNPSETGPGASHGEGHEGQGEESIADEGDHGVSLAGVPAVPTEESHGNPEAAEGHGGGETPHGTADPNHAGGLESASHGESHGLEGADPKVESRGHEASASAHGSSSHEAHDGESEEGEEKGEEKGEEPASARMPSQEELAALRQVVELLFEAGTLDKAVRPLRKVMRVPTREIALLSMATDIFLGTANYEEALAMGEKVLALKPDDARARVQMVEAQYRLGRIEKAMTAAKASLKSHPADLAMLTALATMEVEMGPGHNGYGVSLKAALKMKPDHVPALYLQGRMAQMEGDYKDAETAFRKAVKLDPGNAKAFGQLGMALYHLGKNKEAEKAYQTELKMNPSDYNTWYNLGELHLSNAFKEEDPDIIRKRNAEAMECFLKALALNSDHAEAHFRVGVLLNGNGQYKEAIRHLEASLKTDSRHVPTLVQLCVAFENLKQPERARAYLNKAYELDPLNKIVLFKLKQWS